MGSEKIRIIRSGFILRAGLSLFTALLAIGLRKGNYIQGELSPVLVICISNFLLNIPYAILYERLGHNKHLILVYVTVDTIFITTVIHYLGGIDAVYGIYGYVVIIVFCALYLSKPIAYGITLFASACYMMLIGLESMGTIPHYQTAMNLFASPPILHIMVGASNVVIMFIICMLTSILALNLEMKNLALALAKDEIEEKNRTLEERIQERTEDLEEKNKLLENALLAKHELKERLYIKERMSELGKFVADATHAIKTPLSVIGIRMEETQRKLREGEEVVEEDIKQVSSEVKQLGEFVLNLLKYYGPEAISRRIVNLNNLLNMSLSLVLEKDYLNCDIEVRKEFCTDEEPLVDGDFYQLQHALMNVIGNAIESMTNGGCLYLGTQNSNGFALVRVRDTGCAIDEEQLKKIFQPFYTTKEGQRGVGLGLAIAKKVIERHGGYINVESEKAVGTTFEIGIPRAQETDN